MKKEPVFSVKQSYATYLAGSTDDDGSFDDAYEFTVYSDGSVQLNDTYFGSPKDAADVLQNISTFLAAFKGGAK